MARPWRCLIGRHDWREVKTHDGDKYAECTRCGRHDWRRLVPRPTSSLTYHGTIIETGTHSYRLAHARSQHV
jgi:hypothetical protein